ncbi:MAG TPA: FG-GAP repeat protein, partial [Tahibacter sp.]|nr:FG-GAP repeat protein [Tahibacter sp.]
MRAPAMTPLLLLPLAFASSAEARPYRSTFAPLGWLEQKVVAPDGAAADQFGRTVVVSGDVALIGSPNSTIDGDEGRGAAYVFTRKNGTWTETQKLVGSDGAAVDSFGIAAAIEGDTAIVGAYSANEFTGKAYVFTRDGDTWSESQILTTHDAAPFDQFGWSIAIDGKTALIAAQGATIGDNPGQGAVYVFTEAAGTWTETGKFTSDDGAAADDFGWSVALSGTTAVVGTSFATIGGNEFQGAAYVFDGSGGNWTQMQKLTASNGAEFDFFGLAVAMQPGTILVGADGAATDGDPFSSQGAVYVFTESGGAWSESRQLTASDGEPSDGLGEWIAFDGDRALIGAPGVTVGDNESQGAAYLFTRSADAWTESPRFVSSDGGELDQFGWATALSDDTVLIGAYNADIGENADAGAAYFYAMPVDETIFSD